MQGLASINTLADLLERLGGIAPERVRFHPTPGSATEADVLELERRENVLCELVDGVLVEKAMGFRESLLAAALCRILGNFVSSRNLGVVAGADGMLLLSPGLVRIPDVAFVSWQRLPGGRVPEEPIPEIAPDLAVEILSRSNTGPEMKRKQEEYFRAGVRLLWLIDPRARTATVVSAGGACWDVDGSGTLDGGDVLPGFRLPLAELLDAIER